jgi:hypothetical protein
MPKDIRSPEQKKKNKRSRQWQGASTIVQSGKTTESTNDTIKATDRQ